MISVGKFGKQIEKVIVDNAPTILTGVGVVGAVATAYLTGKATWKSAKDVEEAQFTAKMSTPDSKVYTPLDSKEKVKLVWKNYIPAVSTGVTTIAAIVCANRISTRRSAALAAAYILSEKRFDEYRDKMLEKLGIAKEQKVHDEIAQDRVTKNPPSNSTVIITGKGNTMIYDIPSDRYFEGDVEKIRRAENDLNRQINVEGQATLAEWYTCLGMGGTPWSQELGWKEGDQLLHVIFSSTLTEDNEPCVTIDYSCSPIRGFKQEEPPF